MKKKEAQDFLSFTKVYVNGKSKEIQEKLYELGFEWDDTDEKIIRRLEDPFIQIDNDGTMSSTNDMEEFRLSNYKEITLEDILSLELIEEYKFKPFEKVLVRVRDTDIWRCSFFSHIDSDSNSTFKYATVTGDFIECIPYEGNEGLVGTRLSSKK